MHISVWLILAAVVLGFVFLTPARQIMIDFFATLWNILSGSIARIWNFVCGVGPVAGMAAFTGLRWAAVALLLIVLVGILFVAVLYFMIAAGIMTVGIITGHWGIALALLALLLVWGSLSLVPDIGMFRPLSWARYWLARPLTILLSIYLVIVTGWWAFGQVAPQLHTSIARITGNVSKKTADVLDSSSVMIEGRSGKIGRIDMDGVVGYSPDGETALPIPRGKRVRLATEYAGVKITKASAGTVWVMLENSHGDFFRGKVFLIPPDRINWDYKRTDIEAKAKAEAAKLAAVAVQPPPVAAPQTQTPAPQPPPEKVEIAQTVPTNWKLAVDGGRVPIRDTARITRYGEKFEMTQYDSGNEIKYVGSKISEREFRGQYTHYTRNGFEKGEFRIKFNSDFTKAEGKVEGAESKLLDLELYEPS